MRLSVIIPAWNESRVIGRAIASAVAAGASEVLVVDGGSDDGTVQRAMQAGARVISSPRGRALQQNAGAERSDGEALLFLHADNWLSADALRQIVTALADPRAQYGAFRQSIAAAGAGYRLLEYGNWFRARFLGRPYGDQGLFVRRELFFRVGGFPEVPLMEDLLLAAALRGEARPVLLPGPLYVSARRWQQVGVLRQTLRNWTLLWAHRCGVTPQRLACYYPPLRDRETPGSSLASHMPMVAADHEQKPIQVGSGRSVPRGSAGRTR